MSRKLQHLKVSLQWHNINSSPSNYIFINDNPLVLFLCSIYLLSIYCLSIISLLAGLHKHFLNHYWNFIIVSGTDEKREICMSGKWRDKKSRWMSRQRPNIAPHLRKPLTPWITVPYQWVPPLAGRAQTERQHRGTNHGFTRTGSQNKINTNYSLPQCTQQHLKQTNKPNSVWVTNWVSNGVTTL